jgi:hypothetical protein
VPTAVPAAVPVTAEAITAAIEAAKAAAKAATKTEEAVAATAAGAAAVLAAPIAAAAALAGASAAPAWWRVDAGTILYQPSASGVRKELLMAFVVDRLKLVTNADHKAVLEFKLPELHVLVKQWFDTNSVHPVNVDSVSEAIIAEQQRARFPSREERDLWEERNRGEVPPWCTQRDLLKHVLAFSYRLEHCTQPRGHTSSLYKETDGSYRYYEYIRTVQLMVMCTLNGDMRCGEKLMNLFLTRLRLRKDLDVTTKKRRWRELKC